MSNGCLLLLAKSGSQAGDQEDNLLTVYSDQVRHFSHESKYLILIYTAANDELPPIACTRYATSVAFFS